jgi:Tol biopolymer transport system component
MLTAGTRIGPYEVVGSLGAGGMGEVYRARDTQLDRAVALKVLPQAFSADPDRLMRFTREAKALAALNHPNIAAIYGIESGALVMELVDGEDLSALIARGPLALPDALAIARQLVDALEAAHEAGIVHRDLKPANVKVRPDGTIKVLDFGLAKALGVEGADTNPDLLNSPTFTAHSTRVGVVLGTAAYMAPEQARGRTIDKRADIWAFGVVLYEILTGRQLFAGETVSDVLAAVLTREVDLELLPATTPRGIRRLLARCLERDPRQRLRDIGDARADLVETDDDARAQPPVQGRGVPAWVPWTAAAVAVLALIWAVQTRSQPPAARADGHFTVQLPADAALVTSDIPAWSQGPLAVSPDGRQIVYVAPGPEGTRLVARAMNDLTPRTMPGTDGGRLPFFSPDGRWIGFFADGRLKKVGLAGGTPVTLADAPDGAGGSWTHDGRIVFAPAMSSGLFVVAEAGGTPQRLTALDSAAGDDVHAWPQVLPGGQRVLFTAIAWSRETSTVALVDLATGTRRTVIEDASFARFAGAPGDRGGHVLFVRADTLMAAELDPAEGAPAGNPVPVLERVRQGQFDISPAGVLAYAPGTGAAPDFTLVWVTRGGEATPITNVRRGYEDLHLSPDGRAAVVTVEEQALDTPAHVWLADTNRGTLTRLTFDGFSRDPVWAPDGKSFVFGSKRGDNVFGLYLQRVDGGAAELVWQSPTPIWPDPQSSPTRS